MVLLSFLLIQMMIGSLLGFGENIIPMTKAEEDLTSVYEIYSNVPIVSREYYPTHVSFSLSGFYMQEAWIVLNSPLKPLIVTSNNTLDPFVELPYDPINMHENPIANTSERFAWDYDEVNKLVFIKLPLTSPDKNGAVKVTLYYIVSVRLLDFKLNKLNYSITEPIDVYVTVSADYAFETNFHWLIEIVILESSTGNLYQKGSEEFDLETNQVKNVHYQFKPITIPGNYTVLAKAIDPRNNRVVVASSEIPFTVFKPESPAPEQFTIPDWVKFSLVALVLATAFVVAYRKVKQLGTKR